MVEALNPYFLILGTILGLIDGFNPCILSTFLFLSIYLLGASASAPQVRGSKNEILKIGLGFTAAVFSIYFFFMMGLISLFDVLFIRQEIYPMVSLKNVVSIFIIIVGLLMVKDSFYPRGFSLRIPDNAKPTISKLAKMASIPSAILLAIFSTLAAIPCTSGLPLSYINLLAEEGTAFSSLYILWYNLFHIIPLLVLIGLFYWANLRAERAEELRIKTRKYTKLISGIIMVTLGFSLLSGRM